MVKNITIIGGDLRTVKLAKMLAKDGKLINTYGLENAVELKNVDNIKLNYNIDEAIRNSEIVLGPIPLTKNGTELNSPYSKENIKIEELLKKIKGKKIIAGSAKKEIYDIIQENNIEFIDLMKQEKLVILNTISTAEGALQIAMEETEKTIFQSNVLILGFGRVGKTVANRFNLIGANVFCEARKDSDLAWIKAYGYKPIELKRLDENLNKFDIIINTIPKLVLDEKQINQIKKECLIIDLASAPGGVNFEKAKEKGIKAILALTLPGKVAPTTSAEFIKETLYDVI